MTTVMAHPRHAPPPRCPFPGYVLPALLVLVVFPWLHTLQAGAQEDKKPSLTLKATPPLGFSPLRVRVVVDVRGGPDDYADFYCPTIEWDWGDGTISESSEDCEPYEAGRSEIKRRFSTDHVYRQSGAYRVLFRLKQKSKVIATSSSNVQVRSGMREEFGR
jgi:hypothetical protein